MSPERDLPQMGNRGARAGSRARIFVIAVFVALFVLLLSLRGIAGAYTDYLWFDALDLTSVWSRVIILKIILALIFIAAFFALLWVNLLIADRIAPDYRPAGPEEEVLARFHDVIGTRTGAVRFGVSLLFALSVGSGAAAQWRNWILFRNAVDFGQVDAQFGRDIGFYVFRLPFLGFIVGWFFTALIVVFIITAVAHYLNGGIRMQAAGERVTPQVKAHLSLLLAAMALVRTVDYWLARFELTISRNGTVDGATSTDVSARAPVLSLLILISVFAAVLLIVNIWRRGWVLPALAVGLWALVSVIMSGIYPLIIQRFSVEPSESTKEAIYIDRNIAATRDAFGLANVETQPFPYAEELQPRDLQANADVLRNVPILDPGIVADNFRFEQAERDFFRFPDEVDVDRYMIDGRLTPVVLAARGLNTDGIGDNSWENTTLGFTHGNGLALAPSNRTDSQLPDYLISGVPADNEVADDIVIEQPGLYYGEDIVTYAIVNSNRPEVDYIEDDGTTVTVSYEGDGGVALGGFFRKLAFVLRFSDIDPLISDNVRSDSRVMFNRNVRDRVQTIAPFIDFDADPYPVVVDGRIQYVIDGYTTTNRFPYSQHAETEQVRNGSGLRRNFNYVRNSVKALVDGYDGSVRFFVNDDEDPILRAYRNEFPGLFEDLSAMPTDLRDHLRYPMDLFTVQTNMWARYQIDEASQFYENSGGWAVAQDPGGVGGPNSTDTFGVDGRLTGSREERVDPYYTLLRRPGETDDDFVALRSFVPVSAQDDRKELTALMMGISDLDDEEQDYGKLVVYEMPGTAVLGPALVSSKIQTQEDISKEISLLGVEGTTVVLSDLLIVPIERVISEDSDPSASLLYVRPLYVKPTSGTQNPELERIIVAYGDRVVMCPGFAEAIQTLFNVWIEDVQSGKSNEDCIGDTLFAVSGVGATPRPSTSSGSSGPVDPDDALGLAFNLLRDADDALAAGQLGEYQDLVDQARELLGDVVQGAPAESDEAEDPEAA